MNNKYIDGLVSVVIPLYNAELYIERTLDSVLRQSYQNYEIIIVNDCSKDNSSKIVEQYCQNDERVKLFQQKTNQGAAAARNRALKEAKGRYIAFLDSDDVWDERKIEKQISFMNDSNISFAFTAYDMIDENDKRIKDKIKIKTVVKYRDLLKKTMISTPTVIYDRFAYGDVTLPMRRTGQDYAFWLLLLRKENAYGIDEPLVHVRRRPGSLSKNKFQNIKDVWEVQTNNEEISKIHAAINCLAYCFYSMKKRLL